jgi:hypothetical protein
MARQEYTGVPATGKKEVKRCGSRRTAHVVGLFLEDVALDEEVAEEHQHAAHVAHHEQLGEVGRAALGPLEVRQHALHEDEGELAHLQP